MRLEGLVLWFLFLGVEAQWLGPAPLPAPQPESSPGSESSTLSVVSDVFIGTISKNNLLSHLDSQGVKYKHIFGLNWMTDDPVLLVPKLSTSLFARAASVDLVSLPVRTADWVSKGGTLVSVGGAFNVELLNTIFSSHTWLLNVATIVSTNSGGMDRAICSIFCEGPSWVGNQPVVSYLQASSLPYGAKAEYQSGGNVPIFSIAFGKGRVVYLGSDWSTGTRPWQELLRIAVTPFTTTTTTTTVTTGRPVVLVLVDALFADSFESGNLLGDLRNLDLTDDVEAVTKNELFIQLRDTRSIIAVVIPELEVGNLYQAMSPDERILLRDLVLNGMKLVVNGANRFWRSFDIVLINGLFGWELEHDDIRCETSGTAFLQHDAAGTPFSALGVPVLPHANAVYCLRRSSIPLGAAILYADTHGSVWAFMHSYGQGLVVHLGHDWFSPSYQWRRLLWAAMVVKGMIRSDPTTTLANEALPGSGQQNVTLSATSTSRTAPWFTVTTTTTTLRNPGCYPDRVFCAVPTEWAWQTYKVEGSADVAACSGTRSAPGNAQIFDLDVADCHHTRSTESGFLIRVVTLLPHYEPGHLVFFPVAPIIECACRSNLAADAQATVLAHVPGQATMTITADYRFAPKLSFVMSAAGMELPQGQQPSGSRIFVKLEDKDARAIIAFANVTFSPRDTASDPHSQMVKEDFCPRKDRRLGRTYEEHATGKSHEIIFSVDAFKFAHFPVIHVFVDAFQCSHAPCGQCESRRLSLAISRPDMQVQAPMDFLARRMQEDTPTTGVQTLSASVTASNAALVLPAASEEEKWILNDTYKTSTSTGTLLCTFRVFGYSGALGQPFATQMQESLGHVFPEGVQVMRTFRLPREGDVQGVSENEAVMVEFVINSDVQAAQIIGEYSQGRGYENLLTFLKADFLHAGLGGMGDVQVEFGALEDFTPTPELPTSTTPDAKPKLGLMTPAVESKTTTTEPSKRKALATSTATATAPPSVSATQGTTLDPTPAPTQVTLTVNKCEEKFCIHLEGANVLRDCRISPDEAGEHPSSVQVLANYCPVGGGFLWLDKANRAFSMPAVKFLGSRSVQLHCNTSACGDGSCGCGRVLFPVSERLAASLPGSGRVVHVPGLAWAPLELFAETQPPSGSFACNITLLGSGTPEKAAEAVELALRSALYGEVREVRVLRAFALPMEQGESRRLAVDSKWEAMMFEVAVVSKERPPAMPDNFARWFHLEAEKLGLHGLKDVNVVVSALLQQPVVKAPVIVTPPKPEPVGMILGVSLAVAALLLCLLSLVCWRRKKRCACRDRLVDDPEDNNAGRDPGAVEQPDCNKKAQVPEVSSSSTNVTTQESTLGSDDGEPRSRSWWATHATL